jgi:hypothetical protein
MTGRDFSFYVVGGELTTALLPNRDHVDRFLIHDQTITGDRLIRECAVDVDGWTSHELSKLKLRMIGRAEEWFNVGEPLHFLVVLRQLVLDEHSARIRQLKQQHLDEMNAHAALERNVDPTMRSAEWGRIQRELGDRGRAIGKLSSMSVR